jgi:ATP-binding cassette subfamily C protein
MTKLIRDCLALLDSRGRRRLTFLGIAVFINSVLEMVSLGMILPMIALVSDPGILEKSRTLHWVYVTSGASSQRAFLTLLGIFLLAFTIARNIYLYIVSRQQAHFCHIEAARISIDLLGTYLRAPFTMHLKRNSAELISMADYATEQVFALVMMPFLIFVTEASAVTAVLALLLFVEPGATLALMALLGVSAGTLIYFLRAKLALLGQRAFALRIARVKALQQSLHSIKEIKVSGRVAFFLEAFRAPRQEHAEVQSLSDALAQSPRQVIEASVVGGLLLVIIIILSQGRPSADLVKVLALFAMAAFRVMPSANRLVNAYNAMRQGADYLEKTNKDYFDSSLSEPSAATVSHERFDSMINFRRVAFTYENAPAPALDHVSLEIARGESIGLVGRSGAGKSTLIDVMLGLLIPQSGEITIDGHDVTGMPRVWQALVGYVPQTVSLIDDSLRNNVAFGLPDGEIDDARVWQALEEAHLGEFTRSLPGRLDTSLGERGLRISGGQRQRIGIARALYRNPPILIFDEATAALDGESEREIGRAIEGLRKSKTLITIAHRLSTVQRCDRLYIMDHGRITDSGPFGELLARNAQFKRMVQLAQLSAEEDANDETLP